MKLRYKQPAGGASILVEHPYAGEAIGFREADTDFRFAASVAMAAMRMRNAEGMEGLRLESIAALARDALGHDPHGRRAEFVRLLDQLAARR